MIKFASKWGIGLCALGASLCAPVSAADVYLSRNPDGTVRYASQSLDSSYVLYLKGEPQAVTDKPTRIHPSATKLAQQAMLEPLIQQFSQEYFVDAALVRAVIDVESHFNPQAMSAKGAAGVMQLMPATAARYGVTNRNDPAQNIKAGIRYLKDLLALHDGNIALALASYNAGEGAVAKHGRRIPPYKETMLYVPAVLSRLQTLRDSNTP